jgi:hypothetical protein
VAAGGGPSGAKPAPGATLDTGNALTTSLVLCWLLNEGSGTSAADLSGEGNTGAFTGAPTWATETSNYSPYATGFSGTNRIEKSSSAAGLPTGATAAWAMEVWARMTGTISLASVFGFGARPILSPAVGQRRNFLQFGGSAPSNHVYFWGETHDWDTGVGWVTDGGWHQYVFSTIGGSSTPTIRLYVDGSSAASGTPSGTLDTAAAEIYAGDRHNSGAGGFGGDIAIARIWARDLPDADVASLHSSPYGMFH